MAKVSIIVPVYNVEKYLAKCLDTLVKQTLQDIEIIVVNDGATDHSAEIIDSFACKYPQIISLTKPNGGLSDARNYGISYATGEYIGFVDSDDYVDIDMYEKLYVKAKEENSDIVECDLHHVFPDGTIDTEVGERIQDKKQMLMMGRSVVWNKIYRREWLQNTGIVFPKGCIYEDVEFFVKLVPHIGKYSYVDAASIYYVQRGDSINNKQTLKTLDILKVLQHIKDYYVEQNWYEEYKEALEFFYTRILLCSSFSRMCHIADKKEREEALQKNWDTLQKNFPNWHKNKYLKQLKTKRGLYMRCINKVTYKIFSAVFALR
ncbi:MAG: glycosyltransferase [Lachnospiraceae bacterium]|nr:glycosyltransferase [Lachnospiraceae bacterium]MBQ3600150.1 glycosyltransferase [Lachnospiraceae bacterium]